MQVQILSLKCAEQGPGRKRKAPMRAGPKIPGGKARIPSKKIGGWSTEAAARGCLGMLTRKENIGGGGERADDNPLPYREIRGRVSIPHMARSIW